jgi:hypothetical protein
VGLNFVLVMMMIRLLLAVKPEDFDEIRPIALIFMPAHEFIGVVGFLFGSFVTLRGNELVPARLKFSNYKLFMRIAYGLYMAATVAGIASYIVLYI